MGRHERLSGRGRSELLELLRHAEMLPEMRQRPERPAFQFGIVAVFGIGIEQRPSGHRSCAGVRPTRFTKTGSLWLWISSC